MFQYLGNLVGVATSDSLKLALVIASSLVLVVLLVVNHKQLRLTDSQNELDVIFGLVAGGVLGALTGILWFAFNPIQLAPGIHLRLFAFLPPLFGIFLNRGTGFIVGYVATIVWAQLSGLYIPLHTPIVDGIFVGLTGWLPAFLLRGNLTFSEMLQQIEQNKWVWYLKSGLVCLFAGLFMSTFVAISLEATIDLPFSIGFVMIGLVSDTGPMVIMTGILTLLLLRVTRRMWSWLRTF